MWHCTTYYLLYHFWGSETLHTAIPEVLLL